MPSSAKAVRVILSKIPNKEGLVYELGSGWGTLALAVAKKYPLLEVHAYEISLIPWCFSRILKKIAGVKNLHIYRKDFFQANLQDADGIVCYLFPKGMAKLERKFMEEIPKGAFLLSNTFALPNVRPKEILEVGDLGRTKIYLYKW